MFYIEDKIVTYPCKTILEDVLSRDGIADADSFSPFRGMYRLLEDKLGARGNVAYTIREIISSGRKDFSAEKARPNDDGINREDSADEVMHYYKRLEDIDDDFVEKYVSQVLTGFLWDNDGAKRINKSLQTFDLWEDEDSLVSPTDVIYDEEDFTLDDIEEAKHKLPYLLKLLFDGSIKYKGSLLSFIIAVNRFYKNTDGANGIQPRNICNEGVYKVDSKGNITTKFTTADNTGTIFRTLFSWAIGEIEDRYYRAAKSLLRVCTILDLDITSEDARVYDSEVIESAVCTYILSNEEYLEGYGFADKRILKALDAEGINNAIKNMDADFSNYNNEFFIYSIASNISTAIDILKTRNNIRWHENPRIVHDFLYFYNNAVDSKTTYNLRKYSVADNILRKGDGTPVVFNMNKVIVGEYALLSTTGHLICYDDFSSDYLRYITVQDFMTACTRGDRCGWKVTSV